jgi:hypothetical protein
MLPEPSFHEDSKLLIAAPLEDLEVGRVIPALLNDDGLVKLFQHLGLYLSIDLLF